jgi:hypothetical protein
MRCQSCGADLAQGEVYCPACGKMTLYGISLSEVQPTDMTVVSSPDEPVQPRPSTDYGAPTFGQPGADSSSSSRSNPYDTSLTTPSPPPPPPRKPRQGRVGLLIAVGLLILILATAGGTVALLQSSQSHQQKHIAAASTHTTQSTTTATPSQSANSYLPNTGALVLNDPLSSDDGWDTGNNPDPGSTCTFTGNAYHAKVAVANTGFLPCLSQQQDVSNLTNFVYEVQMELLSGDQGGIIFRSDSTSTNLYYFYITVKGAWGFMWTDANDNHLVQTASSPLIHTGYHQPNLVAVVAQNHTFSLYINHGLVATISESHYRSGQIGVTADNEGHTTEVAFQNARVWVLP